MQIEVGEYKTRCGKDVAIVAIVKGVAIGYFSEEESDVVEVHTWSEKTGRFFLSQDDQCRFDIVCKKPKRINREAWLTVRSDIGEGIVAGGGYESLELAKQAMGPCCIAIVRVEIDCEEGENLD